MVLIPSLVEVLEQFISSASGLKEILYPDALRRRGHKEHYIKPQSEDVESDIPHSAPQNFLKSSYQFQKRVTTSKRRLYVEAAACVMVLLVPFSVHANVLGQLAQLFTSSTVQAETTLVRDHSLETVPLLSAFTNADPQAIGGGEVMVIDGSLVATGPVGADVIAASKVRNNGEISVYTVREGDALSFIAEMYGVTTNTIIWANDLKNATDIKPGQSLVILPIAGVQHVVADGDTLSSLVKKYDADLTELLSYNNLTADSELVIDTELIIPGAQVATAAVKTIAAPVKSSVGATSGSWLTHPAPGALRTQGIHGYNGIDLAAGYGSTIRAAASGEVIVAKATGWNGGYGAYIVIKHNNGVQTLYAHLSEVYVGVGEWVSAASTIGTMGNSGRSTGTHLHFEVRGGGNPF